MKTQSKEIISLSQQLELFRIMSRYLKEWNDNVVKECHQLKRLHRLREAMTDTGTIFDTMLPSFETFRSELAESITKQERTLSSTLQNTTPNQYNMQCFIEAHTVKSRQVQLSCIWVFHRYLAESNNEEQMIMKSVVIETMLTIFTDALFSETNSKWQRAIMESLEVLTRDSYLSHLQNTTAALQLCSLLPPVVVMDKSRRKSGLLCSVALDCISNLIKPDTDLSVLMAEHFVRHGNLLDQLNQLWINHSLCFEFSSSIVYIYYNLFWTLSEGNIYKLLQYLCVDEEWEQIYQAIWFGLHCEHDSYAIELTLAACSSLIANASPMFGILNSEVPLLQCDIKQYFAKKSEIDTTLFRKKMKKYKNTNGIILPLALESLIGKYYMVRDAKWNAEQMTFTLWDRFKVLASAPYDFAVRLEALICMKSLVSHPFIFHDENEAGQTKQQKAKAMWKLFHSLKAEAYHEADQEMILVHSDLFNSFNPESPEWELLFL